MAAIKITKWDKMILEGIEQNGEKGLSKLIDSVAPRSSSGYASARLREVIANGWATRRNILHKTGSVKKAIFELTDEGKKILAAANEQ